MEVAEGMIPRTYGEWKLLLTDGEAEFLGMLRAKYAISYPGKAHCGLEPEPVNSYPFCNSLSDSVEVLSDEGLRVLIAFLDGKCVTISLELKIFLSDLPKSSPRCTHCRETAYAKGWAHGTHSAKLLEKKFSG